MTATLAVQANRPVPASEQQPGSTAPIEATKPAKQPAHDSSGAFYRATIAPLLKAKCARCHGEKNRKAELDLSTPTGIRKGSESGPVIEPGKPDESLLYEMVHSGEMPPDEEDRLSADQIALIAKWISAGATLDSASATAERITQHDVMPILHLRCTVCHGLRRHEAGLDLRTKASLLKGGKSGPAIVPGNPRKSLLLKRIRAGEMPPTRELVAVSIKVMEPQEVDLVSRWIAAGAPEYPIEPDVSTAAPDPLVTDEDRTFWAFQPPTAAQIPSVNRIELIRNPIDAFIEHKLEQHGLSLSAEAERSVLIRRVSLGMTGLPPKPAEVDRFLADEDPTAYERLIDQLLASPRLGERWARFWLDLAGYSDSEGVQHADVVRPHAYRYRDYVIRSFRADKPYNRFLLEQIAGDELADYEQADVITQELADNLIATSFLRMAADGTYSNITGFVPDRLKVVEQELEILASTVMGLTLKCARCHSHKFDPVPQRDYYRLSAIFKGALDEHDWLVPTRQSGSPGSRDRYLPYVTTSERTAWEEETRRIDAQIKQLRETVKTKQDDLTRRHRDSVLAALPVELKDDLLAMLSTPAEKRTVIQKYLAEKFEKQLRIDEAALKKANPEFAKLVEETDKSVKSFEAQKRPEPFIRALWDRGEPTPTYILKRGNYRTPGRLVGPGVPSVLTDGRTPFRADPPWEGAKKTGRRLAFARWLTQADHPLTARVIVNRIWKQHFGTGIVQTLDNFGKAGARPTHPKLLDWLAVEFVRHDWSLKWLHRVILTSATYRQVSDVDPQRLEIDPTGRLLSRMPLQRLDAEVLRDSLLYVSGRLNEMPFGPADPVEARADGLVTSVGSSAGRRRSIYILQRRTQIPTLLQNFDLPVMNPNCIERPVSTVAPQALHLMNNGMVHDLAEQFARRVAREAGTDPAARIERVFQLALGRRPTPEERSAAEQALDRLITDWRKSDTQKAIDDDQTRLQALANICHALLNSAAFLYID